jgi:hypothetical protein
MWIDSDLHRTEIVRGARLIGIHTYDPTSVPLIYGAAGRKSETRYAGSSAPLTLGTSPPRSAPGKDSDPTLPHAWLVPKFRHRGPFSLNPYVRMPMSPKIGRRLIPRLFRKCDGVGPVKTAPTRSGVVRVVAEEAAGYELNPTALLARHNLAAWTRAVGAGWGPRPTHRIAAHPRAGLGPDRPPHVAQPQPTRTLDRAAGDAAGRAS